MTFVGSNAIDLGPLGTSLPESAEVFVRTTDGREAALSRAEGQSQSYVLPFSVAPTPVRLSVRHAGVESFYADITVAPATTGEDRGVPSAAYFAASLALAEAALKEVNETGLSEAIVLATQRRDDMEALLGLVNDLRAGRSVKLAETVDGQPVLATVEHLAVLDAMVMGFDSPTSSPNSGRKRPLSKTAGQVFSELATIEQVNAYAQAASMVLSNVGLAVASGGMILGLAGASVISPYILGGALILSVGSNIVSATWKAARNESAFSNEAEINALVASAVAGLWTPGITALATTMASALRSATIATSGGLTRTDIALTRGMVPISEETMQKYLQDGLEAVLAPDIAASSSPAPSPSPQPVPSPTPVPVAIPPAMNTGSSPNPSTPGQLVQLTTSVTALPGSPLATGSMFFKLDTGAPLCVASIVNAVATCQTGVLTEPGQYSIHVEHTGDSYYAKSSGPNYIHTVVPQCTETASVVLASGSWGSIKRKPCAALKRGVPVALTDLIEYTPGSAGPTWGYVEIVPELGRDPSAFTVTGGHSREAGSAYGRLVTAWAGTAFGGEKADSRCPTGLGDFTLPNYSSISLTLKPDYISAQSEVSVGIFFFRYNLNCYIYRAGDDGDIPFLTKD